MAKTRSKRSRGVAPVGSSITALSDLLNYEEAAKFLRISKGTLENWVSSGLYGVPYIKVGRLIRFRPASLSRWLEFRERGGSSRFTGTSAAEVSST